MTQTNQRIPWPDYVKGLAILLVVAGHLIFGLGLATENAAQDNVPAAADGWQFAVDWIYAFHMQAFFFISGLLAYHSRRSTAGGFIVAKLRTIAYPYFVWSTIQILLMLAMAGHTRHEAHWTDLFAIAYRPVMQFWFLYVLFAMQVIFAVLRKLRVGASGIFAFSLAIYSCVFFLQTPGIIPVDLWRILNGVCRGMIYFGAGVAASQWMLAGLTRVPSARLAATAAVYCLLLTCGVYWFEPGDNRILIPAVTPFLSLLGIGMICALGELVARSGRAGAIRTYGMLSLEIYVAHTIAMAATRIILGRLFHVENIWVQLAAGMAAGVYVPLAIWWACRRLNFPYLFVLPEFERKNDGR